MKSHFLITFSLWLITTMTLAQSAKVVIYKGEAYDLEGSRNNYYEVSIIGYDHDPIPKSKARVTTFSAQNGEGWCYVKTGVNIRQRPSTHSPVMYKTYGGENPADYAYPCFGKTNGWYKIRIPNGKFGYVRKDMVDYWQASGFIGPRRMPFDLRSSLY